MKTCIYLLLSVISAVGAPLCFHYGWLDAVSAFIIIGVVSYSLLIYSVLKEYVDWFEKNNNGYNPFLD